MATIEHLAILKKDTKLNLDNLNTYIAGQFYLATDEGSTGSKGRYYYGSQDGSSLIGPIPVSNSGNVTSLTDGNTIDFTDNGSGVWTAEAIVDGAAGNILTSSGSGLFVPDDYIQSISNPNSNAIDLTVTAGGELSADIKVGTGIDDSGDVISIDLTGTDPINITGNTLSLNTADTDSIDFSVVSGNLEADVIKDTVQGGNILEINTNGLYVPDDYIQSVANTSSLNLSVDASGKLTGIVNNVAITDVEVDTTSSQTISGWVTANYTGAEYQEGDSVIFTDAASGGREVWIHNGGSAGNTSDFNQVFDPHLDDTYIRTLLSGGNGITYNSSNGEISVDIGSDTDNDLHFTGNNSDELFLDVSSSDVNDTNNIDSGTDQSLQSLLDVITSSVTTNFNLTSEQVIFGNSSGDGLAQDSGFVYDVDGNMAYGSKAVHLDGADLVFDNNTDGAVYKDSGGTSWKKSVTTYGAIVTTS